MAMQHMPHLDGLRAFAISAVLLEHFGGRPLDAFLPIGAGTIGVNVFSTLSVFLLPEYHSTASEEIGIQRSC
jgi:peptidoglycan/LPS O-acetylase OafA/YrhL